MEQQPVEIAFDQGFWPSAGRSGALRVPNSLIDGSNFWYLAPGVLRAAKGLGGALGLQGGPRMYQVGDKLGVIVGTEGSVVPFRGGTLWFCGAGNVYVDNALIKAGITNVLEYYDPTGMIVYTAGLAAPAAPVIAASATAGLNSGSYSVKLSYMRPLTGAESNASAPSNTISVKNTKITVNLPTSVPAGVTKIKIYVTQRGFGTTGPYFFLQSVDVGPASVDIEWQDSQLSGSDGPPLDHDPPPACKFVATLGPYMIALGAYGANGIFAGIQPSKANKPEAFPPLTASFLNPLESIVGFAARPTDGELILWTKNSLQSLVLTGSSKQPVIPRAIWPTTGIQGPMGGAWSSDTFYAYSGKTGPVRLVGESPDTSFALPVREYMRDKGWNPANVVVFYDQTRDAMIFAHNLEAIPYMISLNVWSTPIVLAATIQGGLNINGDAKVSSAGVLYDWEAGSGGAAFIQPAWQDGPSLMERKTVIGFRTHCKVSSGTLTSDLLINDSNSSAVQQVVTPGGLKLNKWKRCNKKCFNYSLKQTVSGADHEIYSMAVKYNYEPGQRVDT